MRSGSMVTNIIGLVLCFPSAICSVVCAAGVASAGLAADQTAGGIFAGLSALVIIGGLLLCIVASVLGFIALNKPKTGFSVAASVILIFAGVVTFLQLVFGVNAMAVIIGLLYITSGILCLLNKEGKKAAA